MFFVLAFDLLFPLRFEFHLPIYLKYFIIYVIFSHRQQQRENLRQFKLNSLLVTLAFFHCVTTLPGNVSFVMWTIFPEVYSKFDGRYFSMRLLYTTYDILKLNQKHFSFTFRSTFASVSNVLYALNYSKNFYLYCMVHEDIRRVAMDKLRDLHRKLKNCCTPQNALAL